MKLTWYYKSLLIINGKTLKILETIRDKLLPGNMLRSSMVIKSQYKLEFESIMKMLQSFITLKIEHKVPEIIRNLIDLIGDEVFYKKSKIIKGVRYQNFIKNYPPKVAFLKNLYNQAIIELKRVYK